MSVRALSIVVFLALVVNAYPVRNDEQDREKELDATELIQAARRKPADPEHAVRIVSTYGLKAACDRTPRCLYLETANLGSLEHSRPSEPFVLVSGASDDSPHEVMGQELFDNVLADTNLLKWFAQNLYVDKVSGPGGPRINKEAVIDNAKLAILPIGVNFHTLASASNHQWGPEQSEAHQEDDLLTVRRSARFSKRKPKVFNGPLDTWWNKERKVIQHVLEAQPLLVDTATNSTGRMSLWNNIGNHQFVAAPPGRGVDTHRAWEILALGSIPIVSSSRHSAVFAQNGLPAIVLKDDEWGSLNMQEMIEAAASASTLGWPFESPHGALTEAYWEQLFKLASNASKLG